jgi:hypothetical protein
MLRSQAPIVLVDRCELNRSSLDHFFDRVDDGAF